MTYNAKMESVGIKSPPLYQAEGEKVSAQTVVPPRKSSNDKATKIAHTVFVKATTGRRIEAFRDLTRGGVSGLKNLIGSPIEKLINRIASFANKYFGFSGVREGVLKDKLVGETEEAAIRKLNDIGKDTSFDQVKPQLENYKADGKLPENMAIYQFNAQHAVLCLATGVDALEKMYQGNAKKIFDDHIKEKLAGILSKDLSATTFKEIEKLFQEAVKKTSKAAHANEKGKLKELELEMDTSRGRRIPTKLSRDFTVEGENFKETSTNASTQAASGFLTLVGKNKAGGNDYDPQIAYNEGCNADRENPSRRLSPLKNGVEFQGTPVNLVNHELTKIPDAGKAEKAKMFAELVGENPEIVKSVSVARGGIPATHGRGKPGLEALKEQRIKIHKELQALYKEELITDEGDPESKNLKNKIKGLEEKIGSLDKEILTREHLVVAQYLPKIAIEVQNQIANNPEALELSINSGSFLFLEQTFVSDQNSSEKAMLQDASGAIPYLNENIKIQLSNDPSQNQAVAPLKDENGLEVPGKFVLTVYVPKDKVPLSESQRKPLGVHQILVAQGVNEFQSLGHFRISDSKETYQDKLNKKGIEELLQAAMGRGKGEDPAIVALKEHYSLNGERAGKDIIGVNLIADAVAALGGARGISCKSGKDRTGTEASNTLSRAHRSDGNENEARVKKINEELMGGNSYEITGENTGEENAYAFNKWQRPTLPEAWRPPEKFCGNVAS